LLNPNEADHQELVHLISSASALVRDAINQRSANASEMEKAAERIVAQSQGILKREWIRVKNGE
jgi:hypothetical protein